ETLLGIEPQFLGEAAMVSRDLLLAEKLSQFASHPLCQAARIDENERGAMRFDQLGKPPIDLLPYLRRHQGFQRRIGKLDREVASALVPGVDDGAVGRAGAGRSIAHQKMGDRFDRPLRRGEADACQTAPSQRLKPLERKHEMAAALVWRQSMDLI